MYTMKPYEKIIAALENGFNDDEDTEILEKAMHHYCSLWDIRYGYKCAITETLRDQYENHGADQGPDDLKELQKILGI